MNKALHWGLGALALLLPTLPPLFWVHSAEARLADIEAQGATAAKDQVAVASASLTAPHDSPRRKKLSRPWPVAASSNTSPTSVACAALSTKFLSRSPADARPSRKNP